MAFEFHLPDIGEGVVEGEIVSWKVKEGDVVALDQPIVEIMTDKATVEIPSPRAGRIAKINYQAGQICPVGQVLLVIDEAGATASKAAPTPAAHPPQAVTPTPTARISSPPPPPPRAAPPPSRNGNGKSSHGRTGTLIGGVEVVDVSGIRGPVRATPATRRLARQLGVELTTITGTGRGGRVTVDDVRGSTRAAVPVPIVDPSAGHAFPPQAIANGGDEERIPFRGMRKRIADNMTRSVFTATHFTYVEEIDMTELVVVRDRAKDRAEKRGAKLTFLPFIVKAVVSGLKKWPQLNAALDETTQEIVRKKYYHLGIAAQGPQGLMVTVVRDADKRSVFDLAREISRLAEAVKNGTATRDDLTGSTFTITSLGKLGGVLATPIINFPEVGIIGVHKIEERPAVRDGQIVARWLMNLSISLDHRLVDGWDGAMFLQDVKALLEDPTTMFMEMV